LINMLILSRSAAGYAVFKVLKENKFETAESVEDFFRKDIDPTSTFKLLKFTKFESTKNALSEQTKSLKGKLPKLLKETLNSVYTKDMKDKLVVEKDIASSIKDNKDLKVNIPCVHGKIVNEILRGVNTYLSSLLEDVSESDMTALELGLAHSFSRYKLKFSADKVDLMIVHAISLLDEIDKELNNYVMRCKEWYGWHFPELARVVPDAVSYARLVKLVGFRINYKEMDLSDILDEETEDEVKKLAEVSMGTEISPEDISNITLLSDQIIQISDYRAQLNEYLHGRMNAIAPNLSNIVGELVGARLISHAGSLVNLAKHPSSTVQILGAEKALFRAIKTRKSTPKYGLIYHASLVSQCSAKDKGKMSRMLAAKAALATRYDALGEDSNVAVSMLGLEKLRSHKNRIDGVRPTGSANTPKKQDKYTNQSQVLTSEDPSDSTMPGAVTKVTKVEQEDSLVVTDGNMQDVSSTVTKKKKKAKKVDEEEVAVETPKKIKKKKKTAEGAEDDETSKPSTEKKKKKRKAAEAVGDASPEAAKKKKKKSKKPKE